MLTSGVMTWLTRFAGEPTDTWPDPTFVGRFRYWLASRSHFIDRLLDCVFCTGVYTATALSVYLALFDMIELRMLPLFVGVGVFGGLVVEAVLSLPSIGSNLGRLVDLASSDTPDPIMLLAESELDAEQIEAAELVLEAKYVELPAAPDETDPAATPDSPLSDHAPEWFGTPHADWPNQ